MVHSIPQKGDKIGDYEVIREVGRGGMAAILEAVHQDTGDRRALKMLLPGNYGSEVVQRFRQEFDILARLNHEGVLKAYEVGLAEENPYIVMDFLDGLPLGVAIETWMEQSPEVRFQATWDVLVQVAKTLEYVHAQGLVHRDVTPANIMLLADGSTRLMDFGVVKEPGADLTSVGEVVGTVAYIAPEQITGARVDSRTDLYSLGAVLYLMLTGKRPFSARTLAGYLDKHLHRAVRPPRELVPTVPRKLNDICVRLLSKDPEERFCSASHLLHVMDERAASDLLRVTKNWIPGLVGRAGEVAQVREAVARLVSGKGGLLVLEATYGMGRSALAAEAMEQASRYGITTTVGRSTATDQRAFEGYRAPYQALLDDDVTGPTVLEIAFGERTIEDRTLEKWTVFAAFKSLLVQGGPHLLVLDDIDRADRGTIEMTEYLVRNLIGEADFPLLIVATQEPNHGDNGLHEAFDNVSTGVTPEYIRLGPLSVGAVEELLLSLVHDEPRVHRLATRLQREGEGVPFFIGEMIRGLIEEGVIVHGEDGARGRISLDSKAIMESSLPVPKSIREAIKERLAPLSDDARTIVGVLAVARQELDTALLCMAAAMDHDRVMVCMESLLNAGLVRERHMGETERFELAQNRLKDVVLEETSLDKRRLFHRRIGLTLERIHRRRVPFIVESLAYHFEQGNVPTKAYPYLVRAAEKLMQRTFVEEGLEYLDRALNLEADAREYMTLDEADRRLATLLLSRARALYHLGRWSESTAELQRVKALANELEEPKLQCGVAIEIGCQARRVRNLDTADEQLKKAIEIAREHGHRRLEILPLYEMGGVAWAKGDLESARDWWVEGLARSEQFNDEPRLAWGYGALGLLALCKGQSAEARRKLEQAIAVSEKHGLMDRLTVARINLIELYHFTGNFRKGIQLSDKTVAQAREVGYLSGIGLGLRYRTIMLTDIGRYSEAMDNALASLKINRELGNKEEELSSLVVACRTGIVNGDLDAVEVMLKEATALLADFDTEGFAPVVYAWWARLHAMRGKFDLAQQAIEKSIQSQGRPWPGQSARAKLSLARAYLLLDKKEEAMELSEEALRLADSCGYRHYAMRARRLIMHCTDDEVIISRHQRVAEALTRSLAANLSREDSFAFMTIHGVKPQVSLV
jgi:tetratricopeptide (TPR) repeat protein